MNPAIEIIRKPAGQISVEIILMLAVTVGICLAVSKVARQESWLADLVSGPWQDLSSIIEYGVPYQPGQKPSQLALQHPNSWNRVNSPEPKRGQL